MSRPMKTEPVPAAPNIEALVDEVGARVRGHLLGPRFGDRFRPDHLRDAVLTYLRTGGKALRPALAMWSCGAAGGDPDRALLAAVAIEVYHTWTLVHDDLIDRDDRRRGVPTVHRALEGQARAEWPVSDAEAAHYGFSLALLAGDTQHAWALSLLAESHANAGVDPVLVLNLIADLETEVLNAIAEGEALDLQLSLRPLGEVSEQEILHMTGQKTAALYAFAARAGALIALDRYQRDHPVVAALERFAHACGIAFQLQDDILGILGEDEELGKPVGSDIREGKRTALLNWAWQRADAEQRHTLQTTVGDRAAGGEEVRRATQLIVALGGAEHAGELARAHLERGLGYLEQVPDSPYRDRLARLAQAMVDRRR